MKPSAASKWYEIGLELGVGDEDGEFLDSIGTSCENDEDKCFMKMIKDWVRSGSPQVTWRTLLHSLKEHKLQEAVKCVESKLKGE